MTTPTAAIDWNKDEHASGLVSIGERELFLEVRGPSRTPGQPVVICEAGHGCSGACWLGVQKRAASFARVYLYDRAGYGHSPPGPSPRTASAIAAELSALLTAAQVDGPYLMLCHSWGGVLAREFFAVREADVAGLIFVDTVSERMFQGGIPPLEAFGAISKGVNPYEATGLNTGHKLDPDDWVVVKGESPNGSATAQKEMESAEESGNVLETKRQFEKQALGSRLVVVIKGNATRGMKQICEAGIAAGNGTPEQQRMIREYLETSEAIRENHQKEQLTLSSWSRFIQANNSGHDVHLTEPELIVSELEKALAELQA
ncbi:alpha/beta-hydrolase [Thozetella sp. PMI_491]|nr:alpha/beta-hydrolase [Thozetella sp. PMI_491]